MDFLITYAEQFLTGDYLEIFKLIVLTGTVGVLASIFTWPFTNNH